MIIQVINNKLLKFILSQYNQFIYKSNFSSGFLNVSLEQSNSKMHKRPVFLNRNSSFYRSCDICAFDQNLSNYYSVRHICFYFNVLGDTEDVPVVLLSNWLSNERYE